MANPAVRAAQPTLPSFLSAAPRVQAPAAASRRALTPQLVDLSDDANAEDAPQPSTPVRSPRPESGVTTRSASRLRPAEPPAQDGAASGIAGELRSCLLC